jgi:hypothetical protein
VVAALLRERIVKRRRKGLEKKVVCNGTIFYKVSTIALTNWSGFYLQRAFEELWTILRR